MKTAIINSSDIIEFEIIDSQPSWKYWYRKPVKIFGITLIKGSIREEGYFIISCKVEKLPFGYYLLDDVVYNSVILKICTKDKIFRVAHKSLKEAEEVIKKILSLPLNEKFNINY